MENKWIKDTVHGYIKIEKEFLQIVNTPEFQRLKWIEQGSFRVLYPSARHDRFIHSLGVFGIARECFDTLMENIKTDLRLEFDEEQVERWKYTFLYAALLHDIGHAPFSHTFEPYFDGKHGMNAEEELSEDIKESIKRLSSITEDKCYIGELDKKEVDLLNAFVAIKGITEHQIDGFVSDYLIEKGGIIPKVHEVISATILLEKFEYFLKGTTIYNKISLDTAARMVLGCTYYYSTTDVFGDDTKHGIENVLIRLLNSNILDVDKLDYIIRDTKMSGYDNVSLDIKRLLRSVTAIKNDDGIYPAYNKKVLSTIDNMFRAKIQENMWMIAHPVVEYEKRLIMACVKEYDNNNPGYIEAVFTKEALSQIGTSYSMPGSGTARYRLLSDMDVLCDIKTLWDEKGVVAEYFNSNLRKHPLWKSLFDYKFIWSQNRKGYSLERIHDFFVPLLHYLGNNNIFTFNHTVYCQIEKVHDPKILHAASVFKKMCEENSRIEFSFTLLEMRSDFLANVDEKNIYIFFDNDISEKKYETYYNLLNGNNKKDSGEKERNDKSDFFYIYSKTKFNNNDMKKFVEITVQTVEKLDSKTVSRKRV